MLLQLVGARECCSTVDAGRLPCWVVFFLMPFLACQAREISFAGGALERLLLVVRLLVAAQIRLLEESPLADLTREAAPLRLVVGGQVRFHIRRTGKVLVTLGARIALLGLVRYVLRLHVAPVTALLTELPFADGARVQHPALVPCLMLSEGELAKELPLAHSAL